MNKFEYKGFYQKYDMSDKIEIGTGIVKVHDIFNETPCFMYNADCIFIDPPCNDGNMSSFYTKAEIKKKNSIEELNNRLFDVIKKISPDFLFVEVFKSNKDIILNKIKDLYGENVLTFESYYYKNKKNKCWIHYAFKKDNGFKIPYIDEENAIEFICENLKFNCIGDLCMGKGLVGFYANKHNKKFVGTELNKKRLACLIEHIKQNKIIVR